MAENLGLLDNLAGCPGQNRGQLLAALQVSLYFQERLLAALRVAFQLCNLVTNLKLDSVSSSQSSLGCFPSQLRALQPGFWHCLAPSWCSKLARGVWGPDLAAP